MTWDAYNRRKSALREVLTIADTRRDLTTTDLLDRVDPQREAFADEAQLLLDAQLVWFQRLSGALDRSTDAVGPTPEESAIAVWTALAAQMPGARALLDAHLDDDVLAKGLANEYVMMAAVSGIPLHHPDAAAHGRRIVAAARERAVYPILGAADETANAPRLTAFVSRLKSALAA